MTLWMRIPALCLLLLVLAPAMAAPAMAAEPPVLACPDSAGLGEPFLARLTSEAPLSKVTVSWLGKTVTPQISRWNDKDVALVLLGTDVLSAKPGMQAVSFSAEVGGKRRTFSRDVRITPREFPEQHLFLPEQMVTPTKPETLAKIKRDRAAVGKALSTMTREREWRLPLVRPVPEKTVVSSVYGLQRFLNDKPRNPHRGLDFAASAGTEVHAVSAGTVILADEHYFAGNSVYINHGEGVISLYFHLSKVLVQEGQRVKPGQAVGLVGKTGRATGAHLHLSIHAPGGLVDPAPLFTQTDASLLGLDSGNQSEGRHGDD